MSGWSIPSSIACAVLGFILAAMLIGPAQYERGREAGRLEERAVADMMRKFGFDWRPARGCEESSR